MARAALPLSVGDSGPAVLDLAQRLDRAGFGCASGDRFDDDTADAVRRFQQSRGLDTDGVVGKQTWAALAEAQHRPGDRLLYLRASPMLRGDDVADLQRRLGALGFDAGRVDGIFGPLTAQAIENFQRNAGLAADGICGPDTLAALTRLGGRDRQANIAAIRERERVRRRTTTPTETPLVIASLGGLGAVADTIARRLRARGHSVVALDHPDESYQARLANRLDAVGYVGLVPEAGARSLVSYFATEGFESGEGAALAQRLAAALEAASFAPVEVRGQRRPVLRETRMPAAVLRIGPVTEVVERTPAVADAVAEAITGWLAALLED